MAQRKQTDPNKPLPLQPRHRAFLETYLANGCNAAAAARKVGLSKRSSGQIGYHILHRPDVQAELQAQLRDLGVNRHRLLMVLAAEATMVDVADFEEVLEGTAKLKELRTAGVNTALIRRVRISKRGGGGGFTSIEMVDTLRAQEKLARILGLHPKKRGAKGRFVKEEPKAEDPGELLARAPMNVGAEIPPGFFGGSPVDRSVPAPAVEVHEGPSRNGGATA